VADIFRHRGPAWRASHAGHVSLGQLKVMSAIERCRTAALGGHVERCEECAHLRISYNSCRNRHCPKCQAATAKQWLADRQAELLPGFFLPVQVLSRLFRRLFLERLTAAYQAGQLQFFADQAALAEPAAFKAHLAALRKREWVVYAKRPFGRPEAVLAYLSRYTHRIAIADSRLVAFDGERVTFKWKDYRAKGDARYKLMTLDADEFIRRFLIHILPDGFHRIRHCGLFANANRAGNIALARQLLGVPDPAPSSGEGDGAEDGLQQKEWNACLGCGGRMIIIETFAPGCQSRLWPIPSIGLDSS
jgi:hypothetical protein